MRYFAVFLPMLNQEKSQEYRAQHLNYLDQKQREGKIFADGRFADGAGGLVIYRVGLLEEVEQIAKQDPYVIQGARGCEIHEWEMVSDAVLPY
ncbi:YciI family protein [Peribacillus frigoritolerans]|uniref:YciI family protein n=1 Tax=Peribacillus frigoritolerans TaxID=450367 RepID=UPI0039A3A8DE